MVALVFTGDAPDQVPARRNASTQRRGELVGSKSEHQVQLVGVPFDTTEDEIRQFLSGKACLMTDSAVAECQCQQIVQ